jgi:hypothetical protein
MSYERQIDQSMRMIPLSSRLHVILRLALVRGECFDGSHTCVNCVRAYTWMLVPVALQCSLDFHVARGSASGTSSKKQNTPPSTRRKHLELQSAC